MFTAQLLHDPEQAVATTLDQAILKLNSLMKKGHADTKWGFNIYNAAKDLKENFHHDFIRYLANPAGYSAGGSINQEIENMILKTMPDEGKAIIPDDLQQRYVFSRKGDDYDILVQNVAESDEIDDEKHP